MSRKLFQDLKRKTTANGYEMIFEEDDCFGIQAGDTNYRLYYLEKISENISKRLGENVLVYRQETQTQNDPSEPTYFLETGSGYMYSLDTKGDRCYIYKNKMGNKFYRVSIAEIFQENLTDINELRLKLVTGVVQVELRSGKNKKWCL